MAKTVANPAPVARPKITFGQNAEAHVTGQQLYDDFLAGTCPYPCMGRNFGLYGRLLQGDLATGTWRGHTYEATSRSVPPNRNWFAVADFVAQIQRAS